MLRLPKLRVATALLTSVGCLVASACGSDDSRPAPGPGIADTDGTDTDDSPWTDVSETDGETDGAESPATSSTTSSSAGDSTTSSDDGDSENSGSTTEPVEPEAPDCSSDVYSDADPPTLPEDYGILTAPPQQIGSSQVYGYFVKTRIGACATDRVLWTLEDGPPGAYLELSPEVRVFAGEEFQWEDGGSARERATLVWDPSEANAACYPFTITWRAWRDCGVFDSGSWGPLLTQAFEVSLGG